MRKQLQIFLSFILIITLIGCNDKFGNEDNSMFGKVFRDASDIPEFKGYDEIAGSIIESSKDEAGDYVLGISHIQKKEKHIIILEEISKPNSNGKVSYKILDTINIENVKPNYLLAYGTCSQDKILDEELIALVVDKNDENDYDQIIKAWYANIETGRIEPMNDIKGISCLRIEGSGDEGFEDTVPVEATDSMKIIEDTLSNPKNDSSVIANER